MSWSPSDAEEKVLRALQARRVLSEAQLRAGSDVLAGLLQIGLVREEPPSARGKRRFSLTDRGREVAARSAPSHPTTLDLFRAITALHDEVRSLRAMMLSGAPATGAMPGPAVTVTRASPSLQAELLSALRELARHEHSGGIVPIPSLRRRMTPLGVTRDELDAALLAAERAYLIDLKVANDPSSLGDPDEGIASGARGLLYFAVAR